MSLMPVKAPTPCRHPGCGACVHDGSGYCAAHQREKTGWFKHKRSAPERGYGNAWRKLREIVMRRDAGLCQPCLAAGRVTPATAVDHIVPKSQGGTDDPANCQAICRRCHVRKTARESAAARGVPPLLAAPPAAAADTGTLPPDCLF